MALRRNAFLPKTGFRSQEAIHRGGSQMRRQISMISGRPSLASRALGWLLAVTLVAWVVKEPAGAAVAAKHAGSLAWTAAGGLATFMSSLT